MFYEYWEKVHISYKEELQLERERMERREEYARNMKKRDSIKMFTLHDRTVITESELTEDMIEREIEFWFSNK